VTIAENAGIGLGNIIGKALGSEVLNILPNKEGIQGLLGINPLIEADAKILADCSDR
jgi:hypothetical protein